jgi:hypothetical protein
MLCAQPAAPAEWTFEDSVRAAREFRECMDRALPCAVCAVCGRRATNGGTTRCAVGAIPGLQLLRADGPRRDDWPRVALTTVDVQGVRYCLTPTGAFCFWGAARYWVRSALAALNGGSNAAEPEFPSKTSCSC